MESIITQVTKESLQQQDSSTTTSSGAEEQFLKQQSPTSDSSSTSKQNNSLLRQRRVTDSKSCKPDNGAVSSGQSSPIPSQSSSPASNFLRKILNSCCCCVRKQSGRRKDAECGDSKNGAGAWGEGDGRAENIAVGGGGVVSSSSSSSGDEGGVQGDSVSGISSGLCSVAISAGERGAAAGAFLLPQCLPQDRTKPCMVIDLDETLVHSSFKPISNADFIVPVEIDGVVHQVYVAKRPYVDEFLQKMGELYECVLFTASLAKYADPVADLLDKWGVFRTRLFRDACVFHRGNYVKDLNKLGRSLHRVVIVDNSPASYIFHPDNAVPVASWFDDTSDTELLYLIPFFERLSSVENVYTVLRNSNHPYNSINKDSSNLVITSGSTIMSSSTSSSPTHHHHQYHHHVITQSQQPPPLPPYNIIHSPTQSSSPPPPHDNNDDEIISNNDNVS